MQEIEVSSRLYVENGARYMTATLMCQSDTATPKTTPVTFILTGRKLITVRYDEPQAVRADQQQARAHLLAGGLRRNHHDGSARRRDRPRRGHSRARRRRHRSRLARHLRARGTPRRPHHHLPLHPQDDRPQRRPHLEGAREPGLDRPPRAVPGQRGRRHEMAEGNARAAQIDAARRRSRSPTTPRISPTKSRSCSTQCSA